MGVSQWGLVGCRGCETPPALQAQLPSVNLLVWVMLLQLNDKRICWVMWKGLESSQRHRAAVPGGNAEQAGGALHFSLSDL